MYYPTNRPIRVRGGKGTVIIVRRSGDYPAPYVIDVVWPDGSEEVLKPPSEQSVSAGQAFAYARSFVQEVVETGDYGKKE